MAFMCTMMGNLLPCLGTMESNELLSNTTAMCVLVITIVVNVCIQMQTGAVPISTHKEDLHIIQLTSPTHISANPDCVLPFIYVILLAVLLIVHICSSLAILKSQDILEGKYEEVHYTAAKHIQGELVTVEKLHKHVGNYWIMAESGSGLHFITACFHTTSASGVICLLVAILHTYTMFGTIKAMLAKDYDSDYRWSVIVILIVQSIGVVIGTIVPLFRCFTTLRFKVFFSIHFKVFTVESYWTQKLYEWKRTSIRLPFRSRSLEVVIETFKRLFVNIWIELQEGVLVLCKIIALIPLVEGLRYVQLVEESLNCTHDLVSFQKAARTLWNEIKFEKKWSGNELRDFQTYTARQIVEWFRVKATHYLLGDGTTENDSIGRFICADSMHRITETILLTYQANDDDNVSRKNLFNSLSSMIADIIAACLADLPQIITMKCHTYSREERQARVKDAAKLLGETTQIIKILQDHDIPNIYPSEMPFLGKWRAYFRESLIP
ncbi:hypothetical protein HanRHA438_Chr10g0475891 [Helianthus annuus]|nr:hypothetical protein HanHA89_Chr10g0403051 [Helianthus annuus]KAJ0698465.1 hypothetical protein HanLR1_Chr10g0380271 [Helianthus annuus]KAJ0881590.1 hypothetical protein HanRHA438_Chr10g0475891 [Helianthus annuus]